MEEKRCPECNGLVSSDMKTCPHCGFQLQQSLPIQQNQSPKLKLIGILMCVVAIICFFIGINCITSDRYKFYKYHLEECIDGYNDCKRDAEFAYDLYYRQTYERLADSYKDMMKEDRAKIWGRRIGAIVLCGGGVGLLMYGVILIKKEGSIDNGTH